MRCFSLCRVALIVVLLLSTAAACRPHDPPQRLPKNLGTPDDPILPTVVREYDAGILSGKAPPVRAPEIAEEKDEEDADTGEVGDEDVDTSGADDAGGDLAVSDEDRELIEEIFDLGIKALAEQRLPDLVHLIVPNQQQTLGKLFEQLGELGKASSRFNAVVLEKAPEMAGAMAGMIQIPGMTAGMPGAQGGPPTPEQLAELFKISELRMTADDQAVATIDMMGQEFPVELWLVDDDWYIHLPELLEDQEIIDGLATAGQLITEKANEIATRLEDDSLAPEALMAELMKIGPELMPVITELAPKFQALAAEASPDTEQPSEGVDGDELPGDVRQAIEKLLTDLEGALAERRLDDLARLHPPEHREAAKRGMEGLLSVLDSLEEFAGALDDASPGAGTVIRESFSEGMAKKMSAYLAISDLRMDSPDRAVAKEGLTEFRRVQGQWYLWNPDLADPESLKEDLDEYNSVASRIRMLTEQVKDGKVTVPEAMTRFAAIFQGSDAG